jgi:uncharacterized repeat protein (TIGR03803 family)
MNLSLTYIFQLCTRAFSFSLCVFLLHTPMAQATPVFEPLQAFVLSPKKPRAKLIQARDGNFYGTTFNGGSNSKGAVFMMTPTGTLTTLVDFSGPNGSNPTAVLIQGSDGNFYGTTSSGGGGSNGRGTVFKMTPAGALTTLANFPLSISNGFELRTALVQGRDGNFYGTTFGGLSNNFGTVFKITSAGVLTTLVTFNSTTGGRLEAELLEGSDGNFYGTTSSGGSGRKGTVFRMTPTGTLTTLVNFAGANGSTPSASLIQGSDGNFYGSTASGGSGGDYGTIFKMSLSGELTTLVNFNSGGAWHPKSALVEGRDGNFYGTTSGGGSSNFGSVFKMTPAGVLTTLMNFTDTNENNPRTALLQGNDGDFYGTTYGKFGAGKFGTVFKITPSGVSTTLANFNDIHGSYPRAGLVQGSDGSFYGTTTGTTSEGSGSSGGASVFRMTPTGNLTTFAKIAPTQYSYNQAGLMLGGDGNFYITSPGVGNNIDASSEDYGKVLRVTPSGNLTTLANFNFFNGFLPQAELIQGRDGNFYGTTHSGGNVVINGIYSNYGVIFRMTPAGALTNLVNFNGDNGMALNSRLVQGNDGNFYGTAPFGGTSNSRDCTIFRMTPTGSLTVLVNFTGANGSAPQTGLVLGNDGNFYGTTSKGGSGSLGTIFRMTPAGALTTLVNFNSINGSFPIAGLLQGSDGNFYGTTPGLGSGSSFGTIFKMTPTGDLTTLMSFNSMNGSSPNELMRGSDGNLYGVTVEGGSTPDGKFAGGGQFFRLRMGPSLTTLPSSSLTSSSAQLNATVNPGGYDTMVTFQYGTSPTLATYTTANAGSLIAGTAPISVQANLSGLSMNTVYYYRVVASNAENTVPQSGLILSFSNDAASLQTSLYNSVIASAGLSGQNALPAATPHGDGVTNLVKYAFNMNLRSPDLRVLGASGSSGLPRVTLEPSGDQKLLRVEFLRRIGSGLIYPPQHSTTLDGFVPMTGTQTIIPIDAEWERVSMQALSTSQCNFIRVQVKME